MTVGPIRDKADNQLEPSSSFVTCGAPDADSMKARTLSPRQAEYTTATDSLCLDQMRVFSAYLWEESIYDWLALIFFRLLHFTVPGTANVITPRRATHWQIRKLPDSFVSLIRTA